MRSFREYVRLHNLGSSRITWFGEEFTTYQTHDSLRAAADIIESQGFEIIDCGWREHFQRFKITYRAKKE